MPKSVTSVPSNFDDQLESLINRIKAEGWDKKFSLDVQELEASLITQRAGKVRDLLLKQEFDAHHRGFTTGQSERYAQYMQALNILRAAHHRKPDVLKSLEGFKRKTSARKKSAAK